MNFLDLLNSIQENGGEYPETFVADATNSYNADTAVITGKVDALTAENEILKAENLRLKSENYDLMTSGMNSSASNEVDDSNSESENDSDNEGENDEDEELEDFTELYNEH